MQGHVLAHFIRKPGEERDEPGFPFLCLTVSGGHTQIVRVDDYLTMKIIGQTRDDAAGEAFDKASKIMGLPYPGGPLIDKYAASGNAFRFPFPEPKIDGLDFSFSGLKTAILYFIRDQLSANPDFISENLADLCASIQQSIVSILIKKLMMAIEETGISDIAIAGGVSANKGLRNAIHKLAETNNCRVFIPPFEYCTDNAAMIAMTGYYKFLSGEFAGQHTIPVARMGVT
jgi:N6-L-threonylcarbamoyladenine synthase